MHCKTLERNLLHSNRLDALADMVYFSYRLMMSGAVETDICQ